MSLHYVALLHKAEKKSAPYGVMVPDFPGCICAGKTVEEALQNARESIYLHIDGMLESGYTLPKPTKLEDILACPEYKAGAAFLIPVILPTGTLKRVNVSIDAALLAEIDLAAKQAGKNRSEFLCYSARQILV